MVLRRKGLDEKIIKRFEGYYSNSITIPIINNIPARKIHNTWITLRQGDCPSSVWFGYGIDPLILYLEKRLQGIQIYAAPVLGPTMKKEPRRLKMEVFNYKIVGYCDDLKPAISTKEEFVLEGLS